MKLLTVLIDNYDSFTFNVRELLERCGSKVIVYRNDKVTINDIVAAKPTHIVVSPGPGNPDSAGISNDVIRHFSGKVPILGVCLGEQCIFQVFGGRIVHAGEIVHGKTSQISHDGKAIYSSIEQGIEVTRYHSLTCDPATMPDCLEATSWTAQSNIVMGVRHKTLAVEGVQYHPESVVSNIQCRNLFENFLAQTTGQRQILQNSQAVASILTRIVESRQQQIEAEKSLPGQSMDILRATTQAINRMFQNRQPDNKCFNLYERLRSTHKYDIFLIGEFKRASPSKGNLNDEKVTVPQVVADYSREKSINSSLYYQSHCDGISVLTEPSFFKGSMTDMVVASKLISLQDSADLPPLLLCKDFIFDSWQILQAKLFGANAVLLIVAILTDVQLAQLLKEAEDSSLSSLVEVNNVEELKRAIALGAKVVGINNRNLNTFAVDPQTTIKLAEIVHDHNDSHKLVQHFQPIQLMALSGISSRQDINEYLQAGVRGFLVGEWLMRSKNRSLAVSQLKGVRNEKRLVKICGITNVKDAISVAQARPNMIGLIFVPNGKRTVDTETAKSIVNAVRFAYPKPRQNIDIKSLMDFYFIDYPVIVGVFQNQTLQLIKDAVEATGINVVQLHGNESIEFVQEVQKFCPVIKVITYQQHQDYFYLEEQVRLYDNVAMLLIDCPKGSQEDRIHQVRFYECLDMLVKEGFRFLAAGRLTAENVAKINAFGVDVASGVQLKEDPRRKDINQVMKFIDNWRFGQLQSEQQ